MNTTPTQAPAAKTTTVPATTPVKAAPANPVKPASAQGKPAVAAPKKAPPFKIRSKEEREKMRYLKIMIYGDYGMGKTWLAGTAVGVAQMQDVLVISAESGELTYDSSTDFDFSQIDSAQVKDYNSAAKAFEYLKKHCVIRDDYSPEGIEKLRALEAEYRGCAIEDIKEPKRYRTVIVDSLTEVNAYCMNQLLGINANTGLQEETSTAEFKEYKMQNSMVLRLVRSFRDLPMHVIFIAARQYDKDDAQRMIFMPDLTGKLAGQVQGFLDIVGYLVIGQNEQGKTVRQLNVQPSSRWSAKCRLSNFKKASWQDPTMEQILKDTGLFITGSK